MQPGSTPVGPDQAARSRLSRSCCAVVTAMRMLSIIRFGYLYLRVPVPGTVNGQLEEVRFSASVGKHEGFRTVEVADWH